MTYTPNQAVKAAHMIGAGTSSSPNEFSTDKDYLISTIYTPGVIAALGVFSVILFQLLLCCRCCTSCLTCVPERKQNDDNFETAKIQWASRTASLRRNILLVFLSIALVALVSDHLVFYGNSYISKGVQNVVDAMLSIANTFTLLTDTSALLSTEADVMDTHATAATQSCTYISSVIDLKHYIGLYADAVDLFSGMVEDVPQKIYDAKDIFLYYARDQKQLVVYIYYAVITFVIIMYLFGLLIRNKLVTVSAIGFSEIIVIALTVLCCIQMIIVTILGDFCMDPSQNLIDVVPSGDIKNLSSYYLTCQGKSPVQGYIDDAKNYTNYINETIASYINKPIPGCYHNTDLLAIQHSIGNIELIIEDGEELLSCLPIQDVFHLAIEKALCTNLFTGLFSLWITQFVTSACLFFLACVGSVLYQFFPDEYWSASALSYEGMDAPYGNVEQAGGGQVAMVPLGYVQVQQVPNVALASPPGKKDEWL